MKEKQMHIQNGRADQIIEMILKFVQSDYKARGITSEKGDELDAIITGLNTLGEELESKLFYVQENEKRINEIVETLLQYTLMNFSWKISVTEKGDELDAIAVGLNTLSEELENNIHQLKESEEKFNKTFQASPAGILITRLADQKYIEANDAITHILGFSREEIIGHTSVELGLIFNFTEREKVVSQIKEYGAAKNVEMQIRNKSGQIIDVLNSIESISLNGEGHAINVIYDISKRKKAERLLQESEERFRLIIENIKDYSIIMLDTNGNIKSWNKGAERIKGYTINEILGKHISIFYTEEENQKKEPEQNLKIAKEKGRYETENWRVRKDGSRFFADVVFTALYDDKNNFRGYAKVTRDITERKKTERLLQESEKKFRGLLESAPDALVIAGRDGKIRMINAQTEKLFGFTKDELIGKEVELLIPQRFQKHHPDHRKKFMAAPKVRGMGVGLELFGKKKNGEEFPVEISLSPLETGEGSIVSAAIRDITDRKKSEELIKQKSEELARSNQELEQFAYVASHDLQEPLRMVSSFLQLLERQLGGNLDKDSKEYIYFAVDGSKRMKNMIDDLLSYSRVISGKANYEKTDFNKVLLDVKNNLQESIHNSGAHIVYGKMPVMAADKIKTTRLFQNLIANAIKFKTKRTIPVIEINCTEEPEAYLFSVKDNGIGMKKEYHEKIFLIFQRLNSKEEYPGTGIGLSECKKIVTLHGGKIWVESEEGKGSTFYFTIKKTNSSSR